MGTALDHAGVTAAEQKVIAETVGNLAGAPFAVTAQAPDIGHSVPLSAAYCAERAAFAIVRAESADDVTHHRLLACARQWRRLAMALATNSAMNRPREDRNDTRR